MAVDRVDVARSVALLSVVGLVAVLLWYLPSPGYGPTRLSFFVLIGAIGVIGVVGAFLDRPFVVGGSAAAMFLLGFWQFTLGLFMLPVAVVLFFTAVLIYVEREREATDGG